MPGREKMRLGALAIFVGTVLGLIFNLMHPRDFDFDIGLESVLAGVAGSSMWVGIHLGLILAVILTVLGLAAVPRTVGGDRGYALARGGWILALLGGAVFVVTLAIDAVGLRVLAVEWSGAGAGRAGVLDIARAVSAIEQSLLAISITVFFGLALPLLGIGMLAGDGYPRLLGWVAVVAGLAALVTGVTVAYDGALTESTLPALTVTAGVLTIWAFAVGIVLWQKAETAT